MSNWSCPGMHESPLKSYDEKQFAFFDTFLLIEETYRVQLNFMCTSLITNYNTN